MRTAVTVTLPLPPADLSGHANGRWRAKSQATARLREDAWLAAMAATGGKRLGWNRATIEYRFLVADRRRRDEANLVQGCKGYVDGIVDAGVITDDCWEVLHTRDISVAIDRADPRVEITVERV